MDDRFSGRADIESGLFFSGFGILTSLLSLRYELGTVALMGPGMFPLILGVALTIVGLMILCMGILGRGESSRNVPVRPALLIAISTLAFTVLITTVGLIAAIPAMVVVSLLASEHFTWKRACLLAVGLLAFCYLVFVSLLGVGVPLIAI